MQHLGRTFNFYGTPITSVNATSDGFLSMGSAEGFFLDRNALFWKSRLATHPTQIALFMQNFTVGDFHFQSGDRNQLRQSFKTARWNVDGRRRTWLVQLHRDALDIGR
jgi:hypothetical protein